LELEPAERHAHAHSTLRPIDSASVVPVIRVEALFVGDLTDRR
jgi:hypothetical protein